MGNAVVFNPQDWELMGDLMKKYGDSSAMFWGKNEAGETLAISISCESIATAATRGQMERGELRPTKKPDCDNIAKAVLDALNGHAYRDDSQVVQLELYKLYAKIAVVKVNIIPIDETLQIGEGEQ